MQKQKDKLRDLLRNAGLSQTCATRRVNEVERVAGKMGIIALIWGIKTFNTYAPKRVTELNDITNEGIFKSVARAARINMQTT